MKKLLLTFCLAVFVWVDHPFKGRMIDEKLKAEIEVYLQKMEAKGYFIVMADGSMKEWLYRYERKDELMEQVYRDYENWIKLRKGK